MASSLPALRHIPCLTLTLVVMIREQKPPSRYGGEYLNQILMGWDHVAASLPALRHVPCPTRK